MACEEHSKDASVFVVRPQGVFYPKDTEDIVTVIRSAVEEKKEDLFSNCFHYSQK